MELCDNILMKKFLLWLSTFSWAGLTLYLTTVPNFSPAPDTLFSWLLSNGGHFFFFGVLALLLKLDKLSTTYSVLLASFYGLLIEFIQLNIPGRSFDLKDWALDTLGSITFLFILKKLQSKL
jgi:VanZ family protein